MIKFEPAEGLLYINNFKLRRDCSISDLYEDSLKNKFILEAIIENGKWKTFRLSDKSLEEPIVVIQYYDNIIRTLIISLGLKYSRYLKDEQLLLLNKMLSSWGGSTRSTWGEIKLMEDIKGGYVAILVTYTE